MAEPESYTLACLRRIDEKLGRVDDRLDGVNGRIDRVESRLAGSRMSYSG
jgi:hypothetical protein